MVLFPTAAFWRLDAYFLRCERPFRCLYSKVRAKDEAVKPFFMGATGNWFIKQFAARGGGRRAGRLIAHARITYSLYRTIRVGRTCQRTRCWPPSPGQGSPS